jgi:hypothetical protein
VLGETNRSGSARFSENCNKIYRLLYTKKVKARNHYQLVVQDVNGLPIIGRDCVKKIVDTWNRGLSTLETPNCSKRMLTFMPGPGTFSTEVDDTVVIHLLVPNPLACSPAMNRSSCALIQSPLRKSLIPHFFNGIKKLILPWLLPNSGKDNMQPFV